MSDLTFKAVSHAQLASVSGVLEAGRHVLLGSERDGTDTVVQLAAGLRAPAMGRVSIGGRAPFSTASVRQTCAAVGASESLPSARTAARALHLALRARGDARSAQSVLDDASLSWLAERRVSTLSDRETRALALALALSHPRPALLALYEPLALLGLLSEDFLVEALRRHTAAGAILLLTCRHVAEVARLGGEVHALERGIWLDSVTDRIPLAQVTVRVQTPEAARLRARLTFCPEVGAVTHSGAGALLVQGAELQEICRCIVSSARAASIAISALRQDFPALEMLPEVRHDMARAFADVRPE